MNTFRRWPLLLGAAVCIAAAATLFVKATNQDGKPIAALALILIGAVLTGAFIYSEAVEHRHWRRPDIDKEKQESPDE